MAIKDIVRKIVKFCKNWLAQRTDPLLGSLDSPGSEVFATNGVVEVAGWAAGKTPVRKVEVWLDRQLLGAAEYGLLRTDVWQVKPRLSTLNCGFRFNWQPEQSGSYQLTVKALDDKNREKQFQREINVIIDASKPPADFTYQDWQTANEPGNAELAEQKAIATSLAYQTLISLIVPVYNPPPAFLQAMFDSVMAQTYSNWELCVVDGASTLAGVAEILQSYNRLDHRIKILQLAENKGIAANSNQALSLANGEFIGLLDHDDCLAPEALYHVARVLNASPATDFIYSDHDLLSADGLTRYDPLFKPAWSPEIMLSANYLAHFTVIRRRLVAEAGNFRLETEGAQDWDLFLRVLEKIAPENICHIPRILYHWRVSPASTATNIYQKPLAPLNQIKVIEQHLDRQGVSNARAFFDPSGALRVGWPLADRPLVSIIIPTLEKPELLQACVNSVLTRTSYRPFELVIVDTGSRSSAVLQLYRSWETFPQVKLLYYDAPFNYSAVNNWATVRCRGEILVFLNNDTEVIASDWLEEIVGWLQREEIGLVGAKLLIKDQTVQHAGVIIGLGGLAGHPFAGQPEGQMTIFGRAEWYRNYLALTAACLGVRRTVFEEVGGFDEGFLLNGSDVDLGLRVSKQGYRLVYNPFVKLYHLESATARSHSVPAGDYALSLQRYQPWLAQGDPFYNLNLSLLATQPKLKPPSEPDSRELVRQYQISSTEIDQAVV